MSGGYPYPIPPKRELGSDDSSAESALIYGVELSGDLAEKLFAVDYDDDSEDPNRLALPLSSVLPAPLRSPPPSTAAVMPLLRVFRSNQYQGGKMANRAFVGLPLRYMRNISEDTLQYDLPTDLPLLYNPTDPELQRTLRRALEFLGSKGISYANPVPKFYHPYMYE